MPSIFLFPTGECFPLNMMFHSCQLLAMEFLIEIMVLPKGQLVIIYLLVAISGIQ
jgi:hypothetical protein